MKKPLFQLEHLVFGEWKKGTTTCVSGNNAFKRLIARYRKGERDPREDDYRLIPLIDNEPVSWNSLPRCYGSCHDCRETIYEPESTMTAGYAVIPGEYKICFSCATKRTEKEIADSCPGDRIMLYVGSKGFSITTWTGETVMPRIEWGEKHPWSNGRRYLRAWDSKGRMWYGTGESGMWANLKLSTK